MQDDTKLTEIVIAIFEEFMDEAVDRSKINEFKPGSRGRLDSNDDIDIACAIQDEVEVEIPAKVTIFFLNEGGAVHLRTIPEIVELIKKFKNKK